MPRLICLAVALACSGCVGRHDLAKFQRSRPVITSPVDRDIRADKKPSPRIQLTALQALSCEGERYDDHLIEQSVNQIALRAVTPEDAQPDQVEPLPLAEEPLEVTLSGAGKVVEMNLPTALAMIGGRHPAVGIAQWRVREAYAQLEQARVLWLPSIQAGMSYHRHDGNYQASDGAIIDVNRGNLQYGLGMGATGAGTTIRPGLIAKFHLADAIFQPKTAQKNAWAQTHAVDAALNRQLLEAALAYINLVNAHQQRSVLDQSRERTSGLAKLTRDFAEAGQGLQADADRLQTELELVESRVVASGERVAVASARLAETLNTDPTSQFIPLDPTVVPIQMVDQGADKTALITTGLSNRPELKQAGALVAAACDAYKRQKFSPFLPSVLLGFSTGGFGGGLGNDVDNVEARYDFDALVSWEVRNLGFGEQASRRASHARIQQVKFEKIRLMDQVAREIAEAHAQVAHRRQQVAITRRAVESAENSYQRNLSRIRDGQGLPLEVLQSVRALEAARLAYLEAVVDYNEAQFQMQWAWDGRSPLLRAVTVKHRTGNDCPLSPLPPPRSE